MKKYLLTPALAFFGCFPIVVTAQDQLAPDQNPQFAASRAKYMKMADSVNQWHSTTLQQTYKAYDWYEQKQERKAERIRFRRELRMERARGNYYYRPYYDRPYYNDNYYHRNYYNRRNSHWLFWCL